LRAAIPKVPARLMVDSLVFVSRQSSWVPTLNTTHRGTENTEIVL